MANIGRLAGFVALLATIAGCVGAELNAPDADAATLAEPADWVVKALPYGVGHDHANHSHHLGLSTPNFEIVGFDPLLSDKVDDGATPSGLGCGGVSRGDRKIAVINAFLTDLTLVVMDVTDPTKPVTIGDLVLPETAVYDTMIFPDGKYAVLGTNPTFERPNVTRVNAPSLPGSRGPTPCATATASAETRAYLPLPEGPYPAGIVLVDLADPANPTVADFLPQPVIGVHSIFADEIDGKKFILASVTNLAHEGSYFTIATVEEGPAGPKLKFESTIRPPPRDTNTPAINGHVDGWIAKHPGTGQILAYLADWDGGMAIYDLANLNAPVEIGRWNNYKLGDPQDDAGSIHGTYPLPVLWEGKHYTFAGQEIVRHPRATPSGIVFVFDTTDPANPTLVSRWTLPADVEWDRQLVFSTHYFRIVDRTLFVTAYHSGMWAVDLTDVSQPRTVGVFVPDRITPKPYVPDPLPDPRFNFSPMVLDVEVLDDGNLILWDGFNGAYTVKFDPTKPATPGAEWKFVD